MLPQLLTAQLFAAFAVAFLLLGFSLRCLRCLQYPFWYLRWPAVHVFTVGNTVDKGIIAEVLLNGMPISGCIRADVLFGTADCYVKLTADGEILTERLYGRIDMVLKEFADA
jgi:hypothetical protein